VTRTEPTARPPEVAWRLEPPDEFQLRALLALLFEPAGQADEKGGADAS
jgi:hypothetical protein